MQIHELPSQSTTADTDQYVLDTGSTTRKITFANLKQAIIGAINLILGTTNISDIGDGTVTGAIKAVDDKNVFPSSLGVGKTSQQAETSGVWANNAGNLYLTGDTNAGSYIYFYYNKAMSATSYLHETSAGVLTIDGSLVVGKATDTVSRGVNSRNSLGNVGLTVDSDGAHGLFSGTKGGFLLYATKDDNSTDSTLYIPRPTRIAETLLAKDYSGSIRQVATSYYTDGQRVAAFGAATANALYITGQWGTAGTTYTVNTVTVSSSDKRLKENIQDTQIEALPIINQIKIREFDWKNGDHQKIGVVADELEEIDERLAVGGGYDEDGNMNVKSVDTFYLVGYLVKAVQELSDEVERLKRELGR